MTSPLTRPVSATLTGAAPRVDLSVDDWQTYGEDVPLLVNLQPAGEYLGEDYYHAGGVPAVVNQLMSQGLIHEDAMTVNGKTIGENCRGAIIEDEKVMLEDIDGDGLKDIITGKRHWAHGDKGDPEPNAPAVLYWFKLTRGAGGVSFTPHLIDDDSGVGCQFPVGDLNGDGQPDLAIVNKKGVFAFTQKRP